MDGSVASLWRSQSRRSSLTFEFDSAKTISSIDLLGPRTTFRRIKVLVGESTDSLKSVAVLGNVQLVMTGILSIPVAETGRVIRIVFKNRRNKPFRLSEVVIMGSSAAEDPALNTTPIFLPSPSTATPAPSLTSVPSSTPQPSPTGGATPSNTHALPTPIALTPTPTVTATATPPLRFSNTELVSVDANGSQSTGGSQNPTISDDGQWLAFSTIPSGLNGEVSTIRTFALKNTATGTISFISRESGGAPAFAINPSISGDGRYIAYQSSNNKIVAGDTNGVNTDVFIFDRDTKTTEIVSVRTDGVQSDGSCTNPYVSGDGRFVTFLCSDTSLDARDTNGRSDVYLRDRVAGTTSLISVNSAGVVGNEDALQPSVSDNGRYVVWDSRADNLVTLDNNATSDVFMRDTLLGTTTFVSENFAGVQGNDESDGARISRIGEYVAFQSFATNFLPGTSTRNVFRKAIVTGDVVLVSKTSAGAEGNAESYFPAISANGRYISFDSAATNLVRNDLNGFLDVFVSDVETGQTVLLSQNTNGTPGDQDSSDGMGSLKSISANGEATAYHSSATTLAADSNGVRDVFVSWTN